MSRRSTISPGGSGGSSGASSSLPVTQANSFAVGDAVYFDGTNWAKARADAAATLGVAVVSAATASSFTAQFSGPIAGLSGLTAGQYYFVSDATPGALTATEPTATTSYSNPVLLATSATAGIVLPFRPNAVQGGIWPGTSGQLTSGSGTAVTVGSGLSLSGGTLATAGARMALDANHLLAYNCDETSGTTLANSVSGNAYPLTLSGTYRLDDKGLYSRGTGAVRFAGVTTSEGAQNTSVSLSLTTALTAEAVVSWDPTFADANGAVAVGFATVSSGSSGNYFFVYRINTTTLRAYLQLGANGGWADLTVPTYVNRMHIAGTWTSGSGVTVWVNGAASATGSTVSGTFGTVLSMAVGRQFAGNANAWRGCIADVRISNIVRPQSYLLDAAKAAGAL